MNGTIHSASAKEAAIGSIDDSINFHTSNITLEERNTIQQGGIGLMSNLLWRGSLEYSRPVEFGKGLDTAQANYEAFVRFRLGGDTEW
jgi:hypothetical protein